MTTFWELRSPLSSPSQCRVLSLLLKEPPRKRHRFVRPGCSSQESSHSSTLPLRSYTPHVARHRRLASAHAPHRHRSVIPSVVVVARRPRVRIPVRINVLPSGTARVVPLALRRVIVVLIRVGPAANLAAQPLAHRRTIRVCVAPVHAHHRVVAFRPRRPFAARREVVVPRAVRWLARCRRVRRQPRRVLVSRHLRRVDRVAPRHLHLLRHAVLAVPALLQATARVGARVCGAAAAAHTRIAATPARRAAAAADVAATTSRPSRRRCRRRCCRPVPPVDPPLPPMLLPPLPPVAPPLPPTLLPPLPPVAPPLPPMLLPPDPSLPPESLLPQATSTAPAARRAARNANRVPESSLMMPPIKMKER
jgi:hypothetical protein